MLHCPRLLWIGPDAHETPVNRAPDALSLLPEISALFHVERASSVARALRQLDAAYFDVVLMEAGTDGSGWRDAVETLAAHPAGVPVVVLKAGGDMSDWGAALRSGAFDLVATPCRGNALVAVCEHAVVTGEARRWHGVALEDQFVSRVA